ncbi:MAG: DUF5916 domain-containing protein [Rhodothermales bacterium]|nr:DUF5916 domain-containing protein [Rhodothermales bacterium]
MTLLALLFATLLVPAPAAGGDEDRCTVNTACTLTAEPARGSITVDAVLDEPGWQRAPAASGFRQFEPNEGAAPSQRTEVRILYGETALYVGAVLYDDEPGRVWRTLGRRDALNQADWFLVAIDSYFDRKTAYTFGVNAAGVQLDGIMTRDLDTSWDAVWDSAARVTDEGWAVELRIPYSMLRFEEAGGQWGINFRRVIPRLSETSEWVLVRRSELAGGAVARYGILQGLEDIEPRRNLQITPYTLSRLQTEEGAPDERLTTRAFDVGGDLKIGLSSNLTLDATVNPDFGQVDSDPAELNLSAFESFFPERRPFFTEGVQIFDFELERGGQLLYTRRIGADAPIIGAAKLSGRSGSGLSIGILGAATGDDFDPGRAYAAGRLQQQVGRLSTLGGMVTFFDRAGVRRSVTGGTDWDVRFRDNLYKLDGQLSVAHREPLGDDLDRQTGFSFAAGFDKVRGDWNVFTGLTVISDDFNPNDIGRLRRNDYTNLSLGFAHQINGGDPFGPFRRATARIFFGEGISYRDRLDLGFGFFFFSDWQTRGFQTIGLNVRSDYLLGGYDLNETRGLGPRARPREVSIGLDVETDSRRNWQLEPGIDLQFYEGEGAAYGAGLEADWNVSQRVSLSAEVGHRREHGVTAWASNEAFAPLGGGWGIGEQSRTDAPGAFRAFDDGGTLGALLAPLVPTGDGFFYVPIYGARDTRSVDVTLRTAVTFTPTLSLQFYGQLFGARGRYSDFALLQDRDALAPLGAYPKTHDFAFSSFQTNTVLRWEYRPGSTLFVVWSQNRQGDDALDPFDLGTASPFDQPGGSQLIDTFDVFPTNVFIVKFNYKFLR